MTAGPGPSAPTSLQLPAGFTANGVHCGLKADGALDLGLLLADGPVQGTAVFTKNALLGAHIPVCREHLQASGGLVRAILVNSRNANCATGAAGIAAARRCCHELAARLGCPAEQVLIASTGPIGAPLPADRIVGALDAVIAGATPGGGFDFAQAAMTTDTFAKVAQDDNGQIAGIAKGSGMIHPDMATMLAFLLTSATPAGNLHGHLQRITERSFHRTTVDGDTSPNDTVFLLSGVAKENATPLHEPDLLTVAQELAQLVAKDGEGASRLVTVEVRGARNEHEATQVGRTIATSALVKTAIAGRDPNWGRILSAAGRCDVPFDTDRARVWVGSTEVFTHGQPHPDREVHASQHLQSERSVVIGIDLGTGSAEADIWTCDLTAEYVRINADYRT